MTAQSRDNWEARCHVCGAAVEEPCKNRYGVTAGRVHAGRNADPDDDGYDPEFGDRLVNGAYAKGA